MNYQNRPSRNRRGHSFEQEFVIIILKGLVWLIMAPFKLFLRKKRDNNKANYDYVVLDSGYVQNKRVEINNLISLGNSSNFSKAVLEADKLLDYILKSKRFKGETMGERLKSAREKMSYEAYNAAWQAHKIRNEMVHNSGFEVTDFIARDAIKNFNEAIDDLTR